MMMNAPRIGLASAARNGRDGSSAAAPVAAPTVVSHSRRV